ncbi:MULTISPECIES: hypothetical protein [Cupriavidus]|uniref:hypothetical protein n=1 Tax=Cupriavidus TaxID=106589 RepID=UPI0011266804|nr:MULTISPECIES: hypothetical protein [Cupriavidus]QYY28731.1 hypothetical protein K2O51_00405 [Cupriavidus pinatubonensis]
MTFLQCRPGRGTHALRPQDRLLTHELPGSSTGKRAAGAKYSVNRNAGRPIFRQAKDVTGLSPNFRTKIGHIGDVRARNAVEVSRLKAKSGKIRCLPVAEWSQPPASGSICRSIL